MYNFKVINDITMRLYKTINNIQSQKRNIKAIKILFLFLMMHTIGFSTEGDSITKHHYFKFQPRIKLGAGAGVKSVPYSLAAHNVQTLSGVVLRSDDKQDFLKSKWGSYTGANFDFYFHKNNSGKN